MTWLQLALKNANRRKLRTLVTTLGVAIAVAALFSLISFQRGYQAGMQGELDRLGAHILVVPKGCPYDAASIALHGASWPCYLKADYLRKIGQTPGVSAAAPLLMNALYDSTGNQSVYLGAEPGLLAVKRGWHLEGRFPTQSGECLVGATVAKNLHLVMGQTFALPGIPGQTGRVTALLAPTQGADDTFIYMPLADAQNRFHRPKQLTHILVRLTDPNELENVVGELRGCDAGMDMNIVPLSHLFNTIQRMVNSTRTLLGCVALVALLVAGAGVSNTILMAVTERTREIGVMRAVGASSIDIFRLIWLETVQVCLLGGILGVALAGFGSRGIETWLRDHLPFSPTGTLVQPELSVMLLCLLAAMLLGSLAGLLPAWRASRLSPVEAIRTGM
ncbi:MAG TPA: ABC transporter permease [Chthonomonadaceae bacterium]|nr:ABC transporter permease [Chthonomonadaceae bacterium]